MCGPASLGETISHYLPPRFPTAVLSFPSAICFPTLNMVAVGSSETLPIGRVFWPRLQNVREQYDE
jgi:hypothetical protein